MGSTYFPQADDIIQIVTSEMYPDKHSNRRGVRDWNDLDLARQAL